MLFSTTIFLFFFLPLTIIVYYTLMRTRTMKNIFLLLASLFFYAYGEPKFVFIMISSIIINYFIGLSIDIFNKKEKKLLSKLSLIFGIIINLAILFKYKYLMFALENINNIFKTNIKIPNILLPIGISFFTFQILSYLIDVYRKKVNVQKNPLNLGLYISLFPQLIAGPIVRYETIQEQILNRSENIDRFAEGIERFIFGLGKKVIIANTMAVIADGIFNAEISSISMTLAWLGAIAYTLQIYFDFSGYSDMAIGLGKMFGFEFEENFNYPYISKSITEFWRRWHISLGTWFRDYVYIPLGGSRVGKRRLITNLLVVWLLTGIWHGANWTFIVWGLMYFVLLTIEKMLKFEEKVKNNFLRHLYTLFFVMIGWIIFRSNTIDYALNYMLKLFDFSNLSSLKFFEYLIENSIIFIFAILLSTPIFKKYKQKIFSIPVLKIFILVFILIISVSYIVKGVYNPFIYFNF